MEWGNAQMKTCTKCGEAKPLDAFGKRSKAKDGHANRCLPCDAAHQREYRAAHPGWASVHVMKWQAKNPDKKHEYDRRYREKNPGLSTRWYRKNRDRGRALIMASYRRHRDTRVVAMRRQYWTDPDRARAQKRADYWKHREKRVAGSRAQYQANPHRYLIQAKQWASANRSKSRTIKAAWKGRNPDAVFEYAARRTARIRGSSRLERIDRAAIVRRDGSMCYLCNGHLTRLQITLDHVYPVSRGGTHTADNLRVACRACNSRKGSRLLSELDWYTP